MTNTTDDTDFQFRIDEEQTIHAELRRDGRTVFNVTVDGGRLRSFLGGED